MSFDAPGHVWPDGSPLPEAGKVRSDAPGSRAPQCSYPLHKTEILAARWINP